MLKSTFISMKGIIALTFAAMILCAPQAWAQSETRVQFSPGRNTITFEGQVDEQTIGKKDYVLRARAGQKLNVNLTSPNPHVSFSIFRTDYDSPLEGLEEPLEGAKDATGWNGTLQKAGDYHIYIVPATQGVAPFKLEITLRPEGISAEDFEGYFELQGKAPKGLEGFEGVAFTTVDFRPNGTIVPVKPQGNVSARGNYKMTRITINGENISFETLAVRGVSYQFTGALQKGNTAESNTVRLKGHLIKSLNGRKSVESDVELEYVEGVD